MSNETGYEILFFRQWIGDQQHSALNAGDELGQAKARAQVQLELLARHRTGNNRPRRAWVIERRTHSVLADYRLADDGPVELTPPLPARVAGARLSQRPRPTLVHDVQPAGSTERRVIDFRNSWAVGRK